MQSSNSLGPLVSPWISLFSFGLTLLALVAEGQAQSSSVAIKALDPHGKVLPGIYFTFGNAESLPTSDGGITQLPVPALNGGESVKVDLPRSLADRWLLNASSVFEVCGNRACRHWKPGQLLNLVLPPQATRGHSLVVYESTMHAGLGSPCCQHPSSRLSHFGSW